MRITRGQLHQIIKEEAQRLLEAEVAPEPMGTDKVIKAFEDLHPYDPDDPSMAALGEEGWLDQVAAAADELADAVEAIEQKLINGEYYTGDGPLPGVDSF